MPNPAIAQLIADRITTGLPHNGNGNGNQPLTLIPFRTAGMAPQIADSVKTAAKLWAEAVINLIETDGHAAIVDKTELAKLEATMTQPGYPTPVLCRDCNQPLFYAYADNGKLTVSKNVITAVNPDCPHTTN